jgi:Skp family chaperone for outer membrane proteins
MDNQCLVLLSKFSVAARKVIGSINSAKLIRDSQYAKEVFQQVDEIGDEELILLSLDLQNTLGLLTSKLTDAAPVAEKKYVFGARG